MPQFSNGHSKTRRPVLGILLDNILSSLTCPSLAVVEKNSLRCIKREFSIVICFNVSELFLATYLCQLACPSETVIKK